MFDTRLNEMNSFLIHSGLDAIDSILSDDYICHHGVKGQKKGQRQYQNRDGTWTELGKERRRKDRAFKKAEDEVKAKASNKYSKFKEQAVNPQVVQARSKMSDKDLSRSILLARKKFNEAKKLEPQITKDVVDAVSRTGGKMYGLEYRLKQPTSLAGKIGADSKDDDISLENASKNIKDAIRYTSISDTRDFVKNYESIKKTLEDSGYQEMKCKNYFEKYKAGQVMHKAVQSTFANPDGYQFEMQFQTPASQAAKELKIPIYEERRQVGISHERALYLENKMRELADMVEDPPNIEKIR